jgi:periplasmic divalent cation tolerance protein
MESQYVVMLITAPSEEVAHKISRLLLEKKKAACVNIVPGIHSSFWWQGEIETAAELLLIVKTKALLVADVIGLVKEVHPDKVPEIISLPITGGNPDYLKWIDESIPDNS